VAGGARAPRWHCEQGRRRRRLIDGKDEGGEGTTTFIEHPRAEIAPNPVNLGLGSVFARNKSGSTTIRRWKTRLTTGPIRQRNKEGGRAAVAASWAGPRQCGKGGKSELAGMSCSTGLRRPKIRERERERGKSEQDGVGLQATRPQR
jgi:hypothetical protein